MPRPFIWCVQVLKGLQMLLEQAERPSVRSATSQASTADIEGGGAVLAVNQRTQNCVLFPQRCLPPPRALLADMSTAIDPNTVLRAAGTDTDIQMLHPSYFAVPEHRSAVSSWQKMAEMSLVIPA